MRRPGIKIIVAAAVLAAAATALAIILARDRSTQAHERFRDVVVLVISQRFHRAATSVPTDPDAIAIGGRRRNLRDLYETAAALPAPERSDAIYEAFLGDTETVGRPIVRDPFAGKDASNDIPPSTTLPLLSKRVKTLRMRPDGSLIE